MKNITTLLLLSLFASYASASLKITEIYMGNSGSNNATNDWFEVTNFGDSAWDLITNPLFYDDEPDKGDKADLLEGLDSIAAGESVIFLIATGGNADPEKEDFYAIWGGNVRIGYIPDGDGLGKGGEGVYLYDNNESSLLSAAYPAMPEIYLNTMVSNAMGDWDNDNIIFAQAGVLGAYQSAEFEINDGEMATLIGSPGVVVPEPATLSLFGLAGLAAIRRRK